MILDSLNNNVMIYIFKLLMLVSQLEQYRSLIKRYSLRYAWIAT